MIFSRHTAFYSLFFAALFLAGFVRPLAAQMPGESILRSYERIFIRSSLNTKVNVLSDAANDEAAAEFYGPLCELALRFVMENAPFFREDPDMISITIIAARGIGRHRYSPAADTLWQAFLRFPDKVIRDEILAVLPLLDISALAGKINSFLAEQNQRYSSAQDVDYEILSALFGLLKKVGNDSSYPVLFASSMIYSGDLEMEAIQAINNIPGDFFTFCMGVILRNPPAEKLHAFKLFTANQRSTAEEKGILAEAALEAALAVPGDRSEIRELAERSMDIIRGTERVRALPQVLKYYNQSLAAFRANPSRKQPLLKAISCLASLKSADAAQPLALQLGLYNSRFGFAQGAEMEVILALIKALGQLGYKASFDALNYASILPYPEEIVQAARSALENLRW